MIHIYYDGDLRKATLSKRERADLGVKIGYTEKPPINPVMTVSSLLQRKGLKTAGITIVNDILE